MSAPFPLPLLPDAPAPHARGLGGLLVLIQGAQRPLPLVEVRVRAEIVGDTCRTVVEQRFENAHAVPLEAVHVFPLPERGAVVEMELRAGETVVRAECREREEATQRYQSAVRAGHRAALLTAERADVHTLRVANLPPDTDATVRLVVVERLEAQDGRLRWRFPTVVAPRYMPGDAVGHEGPGVASDTELVPDASRISPPLRLAGGTKLDLEVQISGAVRALASSLHALSLSLDEGGVRVAPSAQSTLNKDFLLSWTTAEPEALATRAWTDGLHTLVVVEPPAELAPPALPRDAVFVVDVSGSMGGAKMAAAKRALMTAMHGLVEGDRFRLLAFDDRLEQMSPDFLPYGDATLARADAWIAALHPRGGTIMLPAIQEALAGDTPPGRLRTVLFVTDGQAGDESRLVAAVAGRRKQARFFTLGIDTAVNAGLMQRLAGAGGGVATLCTPSDDIEAIVARIEARFGSPLLTDLQVEGGDPARPEPTALFVGAPVSWLLEGSPPAVTARGTSARGPWTQTLSPRRIATPLGVAWARERVSWLEDQIALKPFQEEALRGEILRIALRHGIASRFSAFVAVDTSVNVSGERVTVVEPVELPEQWNADPRADRVSRRAAAITPGALPPPSVWGGAPAPGAPPPPRASAVPPDADRRGRTRRRSARRGLFEREDVSMDFMEEEHSPAPAAPTRARSIGPVVRGSMERPPASSAGASKPDPSATLAGSQQANGSFGNDLARTAAALVLLVLLGHTRRSGLRMRVVLKAAGWLAGRPEPLARLALEILGDAEDGRPPRRDAGWEPLLAAGEEGRLLAAQLGG